MRRAYAAACAAAMSLMAGPAFADCCWSGSPVVVVPPTGYVLDPSDAYPPVHVVDQGPMLPEPYIVTVPVPTYSEGGYAWRGGSPYVRSHYGDRWFTAPPPRRHGQYGVYGEGRQTLGAPRVVRGGVGAGNVSPPYDAYAYRPAHGARVIRVQQDPQ